jgi:chitodextrinase
MLLVALCVLSAISAISQMAQDPNGASEPTVDAPGAVLDALEARPFSDLGGDNEYISFEEVSVDAGLAGSGGNFYDWGDYDRDGHQDLLVDGRRLFRNLGPPDWTFQDVTAQAGLDGLPGVNTGIWGDYDNDGDLDLYLAGGGWSTSTPTRNDHLMRNNGPPDWDFTEVTNEAGAVVDDYPSVAAAWGDIDGDGDLDLYVANYENGEMTAYWPDTLWMNDGDGTFTDASTSSGIRAATEPGRSIGFCDYDQDGDMDIHVGNYRLRPNFLWRNDGTGHFTNVAQAAGVTGDANYYQGYGPYYGHTIGAAWADWNNDGLFDLWEANLVHKYVSPEDIRGYICDDSKFYRAKGAPAWDFEDVRPSTGIATKPVGGAGTYRGDELYSGIAWADVDNDGDLDVYMPQVYGELDYAYSCLYINNGDGTFQDLGDIYGTRVWDTYGSAWADYDEDGDLDLATGGKTPFGGAYHNHLFRNSGNANGYLRLILEGRGSNRDALGTRVTAIVGNTTMARQVEGSTSSHGQMGDLPVEFGLGRASSIDTVIIRFPSGEEVVLLDVATNQTLTVKEPIHQPVPTIAASNALPLEDEVVTLSTPGMAAATSRDSATYVWDTDGDWIFETRTGPAVLDISWPTAGRRDVRVGAQREYDGLRYISVSSPVAVTVLNAAPVAEAGPPLTIAEDGVGTLDGSASTDTASDRPHLEYEWTVDGTTLGWGTDPNTTVSWPEQGTHVAELRVRDDDGLLDMDSVAIAVVNLAPVVDVLDDMAAYEDDVVTLRGSATDTPSDQAGLSYRFDPGDGPLTGWLSRPEFDHTYKSAGVRRVTVEARDGDGAIGVGGFNITVVNVPPTASVSVTPRAVKEGQSVTVQGSVDDTLSDVDALQWRLDLGDGNVTDWKHRPVQKVTHSYDRAGNYTVVLWAIDDDGDTASAASQLVVTNVPPHVELSGSAVAVKEDETVHLTAFATDTAHDLGNITFAWDLGDGTTMGPGDVSEVAHGYPRKGTYQVSVTVRDDDGAEAMASVAVKVENAAPEAVATATPAMVLEDAPVTLDASGSTDTPSDVANLTCEWDLGEGRRVTGRTVNVSWSGSSRLTVILYVTDDDGAVSEAYVPVEVRNKSPTALASVDRTEARVGGSFRFTAYGLDDTPSDLANLTVLWELGDGAVLTGIEIIHAFDEAGDYVVKLTIKDDDGATCELYVAVSVTEEQSVLSSPPLRYGLIIAVVLVVVVTVLVVMRRRGSGSIPQASDQLEPTFDATAFAPPPPG